MRNLNIIMKVNGSTDSLNLVYNVETLKPIFVFDMDYVDYICIDKSCNYISLAGEDIEYYQNCIIHDANMNPSPERNLWIDIVRSANLLTIIEMYLNLDNVKVTT